MSEEAHIIEGDLQNVELPRVLQTLSFQKATGILTVQGEDDIVAVSCLHGQVVTADALNQTLEEGLGDVLAKKNLVSTENFAAVAKEHEASGGSIGELLVSHGLLSREQLLEAMRYQTYRLMLQVLTWSKGEFKFYGGDEVSYEKGIPPISVEELLIRALAELGDRSGISGQVPKLDAVYRQVPPRGPVQILGRDGDGTTEGLWINDFQAAFLQRTDGGTSALAVAKSLQSGRYKALFSLHQLLAKDLIEFVAAAPAGSTRPGTGAVPALAAPGAVPSVSGSSYQPVPGAAAPAPAPAPEHPTPAPPGGSVAMGPGARRRGKKVVKPRSSSTHAPIPAAAAAGLPRVWVGPLLAAALLVLVAGALLIRPSAFLLPFPWLENELALTEHQLEQSLYRRTDRAAGIYFLMESRYPNQLGELVDHGLLNSTDHRDAAGNDLRYTHEELSYKIELLAGDTVIEGHGASGAIAGNFILDPEFIGQEEMKNPLILLD